MASTRNKNTRGDYAMELNRSINSQNYLLTEQYGVASNTYNPGNGLGGAQLPQSHLANNAVDIESFLRGTGSTDLTKPQQAFTADLKCVQNLNIYQQQAVIVPEQFKAQTDQRPLER
jgi:hypothetical protein